MNATAIVRLVLEGGLVTGTAVGGACAAEYSRDIAVYKAKEDGYENKVSATKRDFRMWTQYAVSCFNSISAKNVEQMKPEAGSCKAHMEPRLKDKIDINWQHGAPGTTDAGTTDAGKLPKPS